MREFPCPRKRRRREKKRHLASTTSELTARDERRCVQKKCAEVARFRDSELQSKRAVLALKSATACFGSAGPRNAAKNGSLVLGRCRSYRMGTSPDSRAFAR